jgi:hypothetical protein
MPDYKSTPLKVCAMATGGADVDVSATLLVDGQTTQEGDATLVDVHKAQKCADLTARKKTGAAQIRLIFVVVPLVGNGQFEVTVELSHPRIQNSPRKITRTGDAGDGPKTFVKTFNLP